MHNCPAYLGTRRRMALLSILLLSMLPLSNLHAFDWGAEIGSSHPADNWPPDINSPTTPSKQSDATERDYRRGSIPTPQRRNPWVSSPSIEIRAGTDNPWADTKQYGYGTKFRQESRDQFYRWRRSNRERRRSSMGTPRNSPWAPLTEDEIYTPLMAPSLPITGYGAYPYPQGNTVMPLYPGLFQQSGTPLYPGSLGYPGSPAYPGIMGYPGGGLLWP